MKANDAFLSKVMKYESLDGRKVKAIIMSFNRVNKSYDQGLAVVIFDDDTRQIIYEENGGHLYVGTVFLLRKEVKDLRLLANEIDLATKLFPQI